MVSRRCFVTLLCALLTGALGACASGESGAADAAGNGPDTGINVPDASKVEPDAPVGQPDAAPVPDATPAPDAPVNAPDASTQMADAGPGFPDAGTGDVCTMAAAQPTNDTCAQVIDLTAGAVTPGGATTFGDTTGYVDDLLPPTTCASYNHDGPDAMYRVDAAAGQTIAATVTPEDSGFDIAIYIVSDCNDANSCLIESDAALSGGAESVSYPVPTTGTYYVIVDSWDPGELGCFTLNVTVQ